MHKPSNLFLIATGTLIACIVVFWFGVPRLTSFKSPSIAATLCDIRGGNLLEKSCGIANCTYSCAIKNPDAGKPCTSTDQCSGRCVGKTKYVQRTAPHDECVATIDPNFGREVQCLESFTGTCAAYDKLKNCESIIDLLGEGKYEQAHGDCTM